MSQGRKHPAVPDVAEAEQPFGPGLLTRLRAFLAETANDGRPVPGEYVLAEQFQVSRPTIREALLQLELEGLVRRRNGARPVLNHAAFQITSRLDLQADYAEILEGAGAHAEVRVLSTESVTLAPLDKPLLPDQEGTAVRVVKLWLADDTPAMVSSDLVPLPPGAGEGDVNPRDSVFDTIHKLWGEPVEWEVAAPGAAAVGDPECGWLGLPSGAPVFTLDILGITASGRRVLAAYEQHRSDLVTYGFVRRVRRTGL